MSVNGVTDPLLEFPTEATAPVPSSVNNSITGLPPVVIVTLRFVTTTFDPVVVKAPHDGLIPKAFPIVPGAIFVEVIVAEAIIAPVIDAAVAVTFPAVSMINGAGLEEGGTGRTNALFVARPAGAEIVMPLEPAVAFLTTIEPASKIAEVEVAD
jgi:hypothetical protein